MSTISGQVDLTPVPRILQVLGEINLPQWRCIAELVDNSIDGFSHAEGADQALALPEIHISIPTTDDPDGIVSVRDNGPGMTLAMLENAVRAGWSGNDMFGSLGLYGMGFNIATARLGNATEVWTSMAGDADEHGVRIDLDELRALRDFQVPRLTRRKADPAAHGTEVVVSRLKPDQRAYFSRSANLRSIRKSIARSYSVLLQRRPVPPTMNINTVRIKPRLQCVWDQTRSVDVPNIGPVQARQFIDTQLPPRRVCTYCMRVLADNEETCASRTAHCQLEITPRRVHGWIGVQRYLHETEFGLDLVRNGRVIESATRELFEWSDGDTTEVEYPIDDPRNRGRIVGEIHLDHCRVNYTKDRFERTDPAWAEMIAIVRGKGPLRPQIARSLDFEPNESPLYRMFQAFRRSSPQGKKGTWSRVLVVKDNELARDLASRFEKGDPDYLTDDAWWKLVEEQDAQEPPPPPPVVKPAPDPAPASSQPGAAAPAPHPEPTPPPTIVVEPPSRRETPSLSRKYVHPTLRVEYEIQSFAVQPGDPGLPASAPWALLLTDVATRSYEFLHIPDHPVFRSSSMRPLDALLLEVATRARDFVKEQGVEASLASVLTELRSNYRVDDMVSPAEAIAEAAEALAQLRQAMVAQVPVGSGPDIFAALPDEDKVALVQRMSKSGILDQERQLREGRFWEHADGAMIRRYFNRHPDRFLDGHYWADEYATLQGVDADRTNIDRQDVVMRYNRFLADVEWLSSRDPTTLERISTDEFERALRSIKLLRPDI